MRILKCDTSIKSYTYPIVKLVLSSLLIVVLIERGHFYTINSPSWKVVEGALVVAVLVLSVLCIYISLCEVLLLYERNKKGKKDLEKAMARSKNLSVSYILSLLEDNDIVEMLIAYEQCIVTVMASSDSRHGSSKFFDKQYAIDDEEYLEFATFKEALLPYAIDGAFCVIEIDGVPANRYRGSAGDKNSPPCPYIPTKEDK